MSHKYSHLIWLGANTATEPANLLPSAQQATLFEARETACLALQKQHSESNISVINALITTTNQTANFTEYNLPEFSACQPATGLTKLFPGLKAVNSESQNGIAISDAINKLTLADDNNLLVVDILDSNLTLLKELETSKHLSSFKTIYIQAPQEPLYTSAAGHEEIVAFMQTQGFLPQAITSSDPDLPWLSFIINPLWKTLQQTQQKNLESTKQFQSLEQQIAEQKQQLVNTSKQKQDTEQQLTTVKQQLSSAQQELAAVKQAAEQTTSEQKQLLDSAKKSKQEIEQHLATVKQQLSTVQQERDVLTKENSTLQESLRATTIERDEQAYWNQKHKDWTESLKRDIEALKKNYAEGERAQSLALKLQAKAQIDLEHLRAQYQQKLKQEQNLIELIRELQLKLQAAANYYRQLQLQHPELTTESRQGSTNNTIDTKIISKPIDSKRAHKKIAHD